MTTQIEEPGACPPPAGAVTGVLSTSEGILPLDAVRIHADIAGLAAGVEVVQEFRNAFEIPLEATYIFPLPDRAAVTALVMEAAGRTLRAELRERGEARAAYDTAIAAGQRASIAEEDRPDVFSMRVGNIPPGERVTVRLTLSQPLPCEDGTAVFRFPLVVAPRYVPGTPLGGPDAGLGVTPDTTDVPDASRISPPVLLPGYPHPVTLALTARIDPAGLPLGPVTCTHPVTPDEAGVLTVAHGARLDRDFILRLPYGPRGAPDEVGPAKRPTGPNEHSPAGAPDEVGAESLVLTPDAEGGEGTFTLTLLPAAEAAPRPKDVVLVLDRSGSMHGWKMVAARRAAARIIDSLHSRDRFAVLAFDHEVQTPEGLPDGLADATDRHRFRAVEHLAKTEARGATEMLDPLRRATALLADPARDRVLVLVTDGQVGNEDQILAALPAPRPDGIRIHTVGVDRAVNAGFLGRLAAYGQGRCELVESEDRLDAAMEHIHHRIAAPVRTGITLDPGPGLELLGETVSPARPPSLFPGVPLVISGRYRGAGPLTVRADEGSWARTLTPVVVPESPAAVLWARAHLRDLEDSYAASPSGTLEERIVATSLRHGVLCRFTAYIAVDTRVVTDGAAPHPVVQPVELPDGWAQPLSVAAPAFGAAPRMAAASMPVPAPAPAAAPPGYAGAPAGPPSPVLDAPERAAEPPPYGTGGPQHTAGPPAPRPARARRAAAPRPASPDLTPLLAVELDRLRALADAPEPARRRHLTDLITRLEALQIPDLTPLLTTLKTAPDPLSLWSELVDRLTALTKPRPFWKR
ncbi:VWA domain-containing protein [Actinocorallia sp. API 0066]|uniref:VIT domain-containing protein n=1 Tax=Actinocorallia sp. API 0066 TaxID=2896846 RepID=UPI001E632BC4|nr:VIT domain-containing protein [Actinocorallia sp. API 0066]MCD0452306.1 VWA domain-containing protein [Actinocorallia sp. API 0066]